MSNTPPAPAQRSMWQQIADSLLMQLTPAQRSQVQGLAADAVKGNTSAAATLRRMLSGTDPAVYGALCELARWPAGATKALASRRQQTAPRRPSAAEIAEARRQHEAARRGLQRIKIREYVAELPDNRQQEILSGYFTAQQIENCVPNQVLRALDGEGGRRFQSGDLRNCGRAAVLRDAILERQNSRRRW